MKIKIFCASWCRPCKILRDTVNKIKADYQGLEFESIDIDDNPDIAIKFQIKSLPTIIITNNDDEKVKSLIGLFSEDTLRSEFEKLKD